MNKIYKTKENVPGDYEIKEPPIEGYICVITPSQPPQIARWCKECKRYEDIEDGFNINVDYFMEIPEIPL